MLRVILLALAVLGPAMPAAAGAFLLPEGRGQFIAGVGYIAGSSDFEPGPGRGYRKVEATGYLEFGLSDQLVLVVAPTLARGTGAVAANSVTGSDGSAIGARLGLVSGPDWVIALQALVQPPTPLAAPVGVATDIRLMFGWSATFADYAAFVDIEPGATLRSDPCPNAARLDLTAGFRPIEGLLVLVQNFSSFAPSSGKTAVAQSYSKVQGSLVYDMTRNWSLQVGAFRTITHRNSSVETGPLAAIWYRF